MSDWPTDVDRLRLQRQEIERLQALLRDSADEDCKGCGGTGQRDGVVCRCITRDAEIERLRATLERIASGAVKDAALADAVLAHENPTASARIEKHRARLFFARDVEEIARAALGELDA